MKSLRRAATIGLTLAAVADIIAVALYTATGNIIIEAIAWLFTGYILVSVGYLLGLNEIQEPLAVADYTDETTPH